jgi:hypothetical protein
MSENLVSSNRPLSVASGGGGRWIFNHPLIYCCKIQKNIHIFRNHNVENIYKPWKGGALAVLTLKFSLVQVVTLMGTIYQGVCPRASSSCKISENWICRIIASVGRWLMDLVTSLTLWKLDISSIYWPISYFAGALPITSNAKFGQLLSGTINLNY